MRPCGAMTAIPGRPNPFASQLSATRRRDHLRTHHSRTKARTAQSAARMNGMEDRTGVGAPRRPNSADVELLPAEHADRVPTWESKALVTLFASCTLRPERRAHQPAR